MNGLSRVGLMQAGHHDGVAEIKHLRGNERGRGGSKARLFLKVESGDAVRFAERMIVAGAEHHEFVGDVRRPKGRIMVGDAGFEGLPGSDDGLLGFVSRLVRQGLARIFAFLYA